VDYLA
jgi:hypothetical protein